MGGTSTQQQGGIVASPLGQAVRQAATTPGLDNNMRGGGPVVGDFGPGGNTISLPPPDMSMNSPMGYPQSPLGDVPQNWGVPQSRPPVPQGGKGVQQPLFATPGSFAGQGVPENPDAFFFGTPKIAEIIPQAFPNPTGPTPATPPPGPGSGPCPAGQERGPDGICRNFNPNK